MYIINSIGSNVIENTQMKMKTKRKITHIFITIAFAMIIFIWAVFMFWWLFPYKTTVINNQPYVVSEKVIKQGDNLNYLIDACNYTDKLPTITKQFVDGIVYSIPESTIKLPSGCHQTVVSVKVPKNLPAGVYSLKVFVSYKMNPIRTINTEYQTEKFSVIK